MIAKNDSAKEPIHSEFKADFGFSTALFKQCFAHLPRFKPGQRRAGNLSRAHRTGRAACQSGLYIADYQVTSPAPTSGSGSGRHPILCVYGSRTF